MCSAIHHDATRPPSSPDSAFSRKTIRCTRRLPYVFLFVLGLAFALLLLTFRSLVIATTAVALNLLSGDHHGRALASHASSS
jgi:hypothetical protein